MPDKVMTSTTSDVCPCCGPAPCVSEANRLLFYVSTPLPDPADDFPSEAAAISALTEGGYSYSYNVGFDVSARIFTRDCIGVAQVWVPDPGGSAAVSSLTIDADSIDLTADCTSDVIFDTNYRGLVHLLFTVEVTTTTTVSFSLSRTVSGGIATPGTSQVDIYTDGYLFPASYVANVGFPVSESLDLPPGCHHFVVNCRGPSDEVTSGSAQDVFAITLAAGAVFTTAVANYADGMVVCVP